MSSCVGFCKLQSSLSYILQTYHSLILHLYCYLIALVNHKFSPYTLTLRFC